MKGIISLGEALIDFIPLDRNNIQYQKSPGGAPANVAVGVAKLGAKASFLGKVGTDVLGKFLKTTLESYGVHTNMMHLTEEAKTGLVFVENDENGERSFTFFIKTSADQLLNEEEIEELYFKENKVFHFGSISLIHEPIKAATLKSIRLAKENGMILSYDPNLRLGLWENEGIARETIMSVMSEADLLKISEEELEFLTGETTIKAGLAQFKQYEIPLILVTLGAEGCYVQFKETLSHVPAKKVQAVDTTGAGDAFVSGILFQVNESEKSFAEMEVEEVKEMVRFASISGGLAASAKGAMTALPTLEELKKNL